MELIRRMQIVRRSNIPFLWIGFGKKEDIGPEEIKTETLATTVNRIDNVDVILVHDGHRFGDLVYAIRLFLRSKKHVIVSGDDVDVNGNSTLITNLVSIAQKVDKLIAICVKCHNDAPLIGVDKENKFINLCFDCFEKQNY